MNTHSRRDFIRAMGVATAACALPAVSAPTQRPNVLFIAVDDLRPQLGCYGHTQTLSPNIDQLASRGIRFSRSYCQVPTCGASRCSLLTGIRPTPRRFTGYNSWVDEDASTAVTLPQTFNEAGYYTLSNGKIFHHASDTGRRSWSEPAWRPKKGGLKFLDPDSANYIHPKSRRGPFFEAPDVPDNAYPDGMIADRTIADLKRLKEKDQPFFLACGFQKPHLPFYAPKKYWDLYDRESIELADNRYRPKNAPDSLKGSTEFRNYHDRDIAFNSTEFHKISRHGYYACVSYVDAQVGRVLDTLDALGLRDNTIVVLWGDHGWHLGEHNFWSKHNLMHHAMNAPLMVSAPGFNGGKQSDALVEFIDIYPTLCDLACLPKIDQLQGKSFMPLMKNPDAPWKEAAFTRYKKGDAIITERYTYAEYDARGKTERMLYDHHTDPQENVNIAEERENKAAVKRLSQMLDEGRQTARKWPE